MLAPMLAVGRSGRTRGVVAATFALLAALLFAVAPARAQQQVRLAAPADCLTNAACGAGLASTYRLDVRDAFVPLTVADAGVSALDNGLAEVAVVFSSSPAAGRPDVVTLRDDRHMLYRDRVVPVVRSALLRAYGKRGAADIRRRLDEASATLSTSALRDLNSWLLTGRIAEAVGGEFADANGLTGDGGSRRGPVIRIGYQDFDENEMLAYLYAETLRTAGYRVRVRSVGGFRREAVARLRRDRLDLYVDYDGSLLRHLVGTRPARLRAGLARTLRRIGAEALRVSSAEDRNVFVAKRDVAGRLGISAISDLRRYWGG